MSTTEGRMSAAADQSPVRQSAASLAAPPVEDAPLVELRAVSKSYPGVLALDRVDLEIHRNEVHALVGLNGAGKSTLVKILAGVAESDSGETLVNGAAVRMGGPWDARRHGIVLVPQEVACNPSLTPGRNAMLGAERFWVRKDRLDSEERERVRGALERLGVGFGENARIDQLSVPEQRALQIAAGLLREGSLLVLDEPTAVLSDADAEMLISRLRDLRGQGQSIVYVSHRLGEVLDLADRVTVLRDGKQVETAPADDLDRERLIALMSGKDERARRAREDPISLVEERPDDTSSEAAAEDGPPVLEVRSLVAGNLVNRIDLEVRPGQVAALVGVQGAGQGRALHTIAGLEPPDAGEIRVAGEALELGSIEASYRAGVVLLPADRRRAGIVPLLGLQENLALPPRSGSRRMGLRMLRSERQIARDYKQSFAIKATGISAAAGTLSGGNQQKVALARAIECRPRVLLLEEPTQGIDVHGKAEVARLIRGLVEEGGRAAVVATSEIEEVLDLADVVYVVRRGRISARLDPREVTRRDVLEHAL